MAAAVHFHTQLALRGPAYRGSACTDPRGSPSPTTGSFIMAKASTIEASISERGKWCSRLSECLEGGARGLNGDALKIFAGEVRPCDAVAVRTLILPIPGIPQSCQMLSEHQSAFPPVRGISRVAASSQQLSSPRSVLVSTSRTRQKRIARTACERIGCCYMYEIRRRLTGCSPHQKASSVLNLYPIPRALPPISRSTSCDQTETWTPSTQKPIRATLSVILALGTFESESDRADLSR